ncbi:MAG: hypothetical protein KDE35_13565 [Geminicoccaceae bacterium]|nr:hypothetical protein [Geminicoccaceae bacterium]
MILLAMLVPAPASALTRPLVPAAKPAELAMVLARLAAIEARQRRYEYRIPVARPDLDAIEPAVGHTEIPGLEISVGRDDPAASVLPVVVFGGPVLASPSIVVAEALLARGEERARDTADLPLLAGLIKAWEGLAEVAAALDEHAEARIAYRRVLRQFEDLPASLAGRVDLADARQRALEQWGDLSFRLSFFADANLAYEELAEYRFSRATYGTPAPDLTAWQNLARTMIKLAAARMHLDDPRAARSALNAARRTTEAMIGDKATSERDRTALRKQLAFIGTQMAALQDDMLVTAQFDG